MISYFAWKPFYVAIIGVAYAFAVFEIGFYGPFIFYFIATYMTGLRDHKMIVLTAVILFPLLYVFFTVALGAFLSKASCSSVGGERLMESLEFLNNVLTLANIGAMLVGIIVD